VLRLNSIMPSDSRTSCVLWCRSKLLRMLIFPRILRWRCMGIFYCFFYLGCLLQRIWIHCLYNPGPNMWVLCPTSTFPQTCGDSPSSSALPVCCESASTCSYGYTSGLGNINYCTGTCGDLTCPSGQGCCLDNATGHRCYDVTVDECAFDAAGGYTLCPIGYQGCAGACYNSADYCCPSGVLTQKEFC